MCFDMPCRLISNLSARPFGVSVCWAIRLMISRRVGSAIAWNTSRLIVNHGNRQPFGSKYKRNRSVSQIFFKKLLCVLRVASVSSVVKFLTTEGAEESQRNTEVDMRQISDGVKTKRGRKRPLFICYMEVFILFRNGRSSATQTGRLEVFFLTARLWSVPMRR